MRTIAIMSPKGGIAKTTSADTIAYILGEEKGKKVLVACFWNKNRTDGND